MNLVDRFSILGTPVRRSLGQAGWAEDEAKWSHENLARPYKYESEHNLATTYAAYMDAFKTGDKAKTETAFAAYRDAYDAYNEETPLRTELERIADEVRMNYSSGDLPGAKEAHRIWMQGRLDAMEKLWLGWYKAHLDWEMYQYTGGQPEWHRNLKESGASLLDIALQVLPFLPYVKGAAVATRGALQRLPRLPLPAAATPSMPKTPVMTPGGRSVIQPARYPVVNESGKPASRAYAPMTTALSPGKPPSKAQAAAPSIMTPSGGSGAGGAGTPPPVPSGGWKPPQGYIALTLEQERAITSLKWNDPKYPDYVVDPVSKKTFYKDVQVRPILEAKGVAPPPFETTMPVKSNIPDHLRPLPEPAILKKYPPEVRKAFMDVQRFMIDAGQSTYEYTYNQLERTDESYWKDELNQLMQDMGYHVTGPVPLAPLPGETLPVAKRGFAPTGGAPEPGPSLLYPIPAKLRVPGLLRSLGPSPYYESSGPTGPGTGPWYSPVSPFIETNPGSVPFEPHFKWGDAPQSKAPSEPAPVATEGAGSNRCPPGQFWDGNKCRGSVDAMPGIPTDQATAQAAAFPNIGRRFPVVNF